MEDNLDLVEEGKEEWVQVIDKFYQPFKVEVDKAEVEIEKVQIKDEQLDLTVKMWTSNGY